MAESSKPLTNGETGNEPTPRDLAERRTLYGLGDGLEDDFGAVHLAGKNIAGQETLAMLAVAAANQRHGKNTEYARRRELPADGALGQREVYAAARGAPAPSEEAGALLRVGSGLLDGCLVTARLDRKYVNHVLEGGLGRELAP